MSSITRAAVLDAITQLGFRPNRAARALAGGPVQSVTVLASNTSLYGFAAALEGVEEATRETGFGMGVRVIEAETPTEVREAVAGSLEPAGALIVIAFDKAGALALDCVPADIPTAGIIPTPVTTQPPSRPSVWIDEFEAARAATEYLLSLGHETVHHLSIPNWSGTPRRMQAWRSALKGAKAPVPKALHGGWGAEWGYEAGCALAKDRRVTALLCGNDDIALGAIRAMNEAGRGVPDDVSIVGFDDMPYARFLTPALTTVRQDFRGLGKAGFFRLLAALEPHRELPVIDSPQATLVVRESAGPPRRRGRRVLPSGAAIAATTAAAPVARSRSTRSAGA